MGYTVLMPTIIVNDQELFYTYRKGPAGAPAVLLLHGAGGTRLDWPADLRRLPNAAVYALDLPGHGRSAPPGRETIEDYADVVQALLERLELDEVIVVGHSMGGAIAQTLALRELPRLAGLVLLSTGARLRVSDAILGRSEEEFAEVVDFMMEYGWAPEAPAELTTMARELLLQNDPATVHGDFLACHRFDVMGAVDAIDLPVLVSCGTADRMTPLKFSEYLAGQIPDARLVTVEGGGHMMALEQPAVVTAAVREFVDEVAAG